MPTEPKTVGKWVREYFELNVDAGHPVLKTTWERMCGDPVLDATLIPLADGQQVVVEAGVWEAAVCRYAGYPACNTREQAGAVYGPRRDDGSEFDEAWELAELGAISILTALFPAGIEVADEVGVIDHFEGFGIHVCEVAIKDDSSAVPEGYRIETICTGDIVYIGHAEEKL